MKRVAIAVVMLLALAALLWWWYWRGAEREQVLPVLYGNIEIREARLAFNGDQKVARVLVDEGDQVTAGQLLAELDTSRLSADVDARMAAAKAQEQAVLRLRNGTRPEEIQRTQAALEVSQVRLANAQRSLKRAEEAIATGAVSRQQLDDAQSAADSAAADVTSARAALRLAEIGPRTEDIAEADAQLNRLRAELKLSERRLADSRLYAPGNGIIRTRVVEVGEMTSPSQPAFSLSLTDQKWVRAYVSEPDLGRVKPGAAASVLSDSFPGKEYAGWVGHISPQAEFTPKSVQTEELRTALVYEVRVYVKDPDEELRLGMPVTVRLHEGRPATSPSTQASRVHEGT